MADRGLYGQTESDAGVINAAKESRGNIEAEGLRTSDGNVTEEGYRIAMSKAARRDFEARRGEDNAQRSASRSRRTSPPQCGPRASLWATYTPP